MKKLWMLAVASLVSTPALAAEHNILAPVPGLHGPTVPFDPAKAPTAPDYAQKNAWAADGGGDSNMWGPAGQNLLYPESRKAAVFFIHPTSYFGESWNQPLDDAKTNRRTDEGSIRNQASAFNLCCRLYAPRYRQMTFNGFLDPSANTEAALDLAYSDVKRAFEYFLAHDGAKGPIIIASHSQGSRHAKHLIQDMIDGTPLADRLVAAYVVGTMLDEDYFAKLKAVKPCEAATDLHCVLTWSTLRDDADGDKFRAGFAMRSTQGMELAQHKFVCTNPLTWSESSELAPASTDEGGWVYGLGSKPRPIDPHLVSGRCDDGVLFVSRPDGFLYNALVMPNGNYHDYDYQLAYMNIRNNAVDRVNAWLAAHK